MDSELRKEIEELIKELRQQDSIEIGNSKTGTIKVYGDASNPEEFEKKLTSQIEILKKHREEVLGK